MAKISIVVPVYNAEKTLQRCVDSILNQTFQDFDLILINDGSLDNSGIICDEYKQLDERIRVIHQENGGQSLARNNGISIATSKYISFVDSDDFIDINMYEVLYNLIINEDADISSCLHQDRKEGERIKTGQLVTLEDFNWEVYEDEGVIEEFLKTDNFGRAPWSNLYKWDLFQNISFQVGKIHEDNFVSYQLFSKAKKAVHINYVGYFYMSNPHSTTKSQFTLKQFDLITEERRILADVQEKYPSLTIFEEKNLARRYRWIFSKIIRDMSNRNTREGNKESYANIAKTYFKEDLNHFNHNKVIGRKLKTFLYLFYISPTLLGLTYKMYVSLIPKNSRV